MKIKHTLIGTSLCILTTTAAIGQIVMTQALSGNGQLKWSDVGSAFVHPTAYTIEWSPRIGSTQDVWSPFAVIPATNTAYSVDVPMFYRLRASVEGRFPQLKIAVFSDIHYFDPSLLVHDGTAFQQTLASDNKMLKESGAILDEVMAEVGTANLVLVTGDLTKDGELLCHQGVVSRLQQLKVGGAKVFVIPGNHDINNPHALSYDGDKATPVATISAGAFASLYAGFGYADALARDTNSLSYVAEPVPGLWILALDSCHYERNTNGTVFDGGYFDAPRLDWIKSQLAEARSRGKYVLAMMHHGLLEHYAGQKTLFPDFVIDDYQTVASVFASYGVEVVFTGHYHAQDIVRGTFGRSAIYDVEAGSTVTFPCPYRLLSLNTNGDLSITSHPITHINFDTGGVPFPTYASNTVHSQVLGISTYMLTSPPYSLAPASAQFLAPGLTEGFVSHYQGDEGSRPISAGTQAIIAYLQAQTDPMSRMMLNALLSIFTDLPPGDNSLTLNLITGQTQ
jgi:3',5'-cyclic AMP phosphodiesterase CpdA